MGSREFLFPSIVWYKTSGEFFQIISKFTLIYNRQQKKIPFNVKIVNFFVEKKKHSGNVEDGCIE
jgi:hypothetical protein